MDKGGAKAERGYPGPMRGDDRQNGDSIANVSLRSLIKFSGSVQ